MGIQGIVLAKTGGLYRVSCDGRIVEANLRGRLRQSGRERVLVGDRVVVTEHDDGGATVEEVEPRSSVLKRRTPGGHRGVRHVAANVDQVVVVGATRRPAWNAHTMDRFTAVAEANGLAVTLVVNKCDLCDRSDVLALPYRTAGYRVVLTSVPNREGLDELASYLDGCISLLTGPTGVGKSSLLNAMQPGLKLRTSEVSEKSGGGRHTTVAAEMYPFGPSGFVVDTPGLRDIGLWGLEPLEVAAAFPELEKFETDCRFDNCRHLEEPGCAVARAAQNGQMAASRLASYRRLLDEAVAAARDW
ncbi:MAG: ribosome small subunit-dependent GTPase A [Gemmatimonadales bacterium]